MSSIGTQYSTRLLPVEWPQATTRLASRNVKKHVKKTKGVKKREARRHGSRLSTNKLVLCAKTTADQETQTDNKGWACEGNGNEIEYNTRETSVEAIRDDVIYDGAEEAPGNELTNIFESLNRDEATWLAEEVHQVNKKVFVAEQTAQKLKNTDLNNKKTSLNTLQELLKDLHRNIKYPDAETAKDLDTLDEASSNFGVRNMVNYLGLLDGYFNNLQGQINDSH